MTRSKFREQQIAFILRQAEDGTSVEEVCRKAEISVHRRRNAVMIVAVRHAARLSPEKF